MTAVVSMWPERLVDEIPAGFIGSPGGTGVVLAFNVFISQYSKLSPERVGLGSS